MLEYRSFVKKLVFPLEILPVNLVISGAVTEAIGLGIFTPGLLFLASCAAVVGAVAAAADRASALLRSASAGFWRRSAYFCATWDRLSASF